jgi:hypothetical protein
MMRRASPKVKRILKRELENFLTIAKLELFKK